MCVTVYEMCSCLTESDLFWTMECMAHPYSSVIIFFRLL